MLLFLPFDLRAPLPTVDLVANGEPFHLFDDLDAARDAARRSDGQIDRLLVLDAALVEAKPVTIPRRAILNVDPDGDYWRPDPVEAGGGYVVREAAEGLEVLLIHRRGAWDLPKGKLDDGETPERAAVREVAEEVGIKKKRLRVLGPLPPTVHGYVWPRQQVYAVKTTHWYAMQTTADRFKPEKREGIKKVRWVAWEEARGRLGYESLRNHLASLDTDDLSARLAQETG